MSIKIVPDSNSLRNYRIAYALSGLTLITIFGPNVLGFDSPLALPVFFEGLAPIFSGVGVGLLVFKDIFNINIPVILIDNSEIRAKHSFWTQSFAWKRLKQVSLYKNRIELTYRQSERTDSIKMPFLLRSRSPEICDALQEMCSHHDIEFEVTYPFQPTSKSYVFQNNH